MKKTSFLFGAAVLMMTSCSSDEVVDMAPTPAIGFNTFMNNSTRATSPEPDAVDLVGGTTPTFTNFDVWAIKWNATQAPNQVFVAQQVNLKTEGWKYDPVRYWVSGNNYRFTALAPSKAKGVNVTNQSIDPITDFLSVKGGLELTFDNGDTESGANAAVDLCIATNKLENVPANPGLVGLQFSHMLSRVKFTFKNGFESQQSVLLIKDVKIENAVKDASINTITDGNWTNTSGSTFSLDFVLNPTDGLNTEVINGGGQTQDTKHRYVIPIQESRDYNVCFSVTLKNYDPQTSDFTEVGTWQHTIKLPVSTFTKNFSYNFIAELNATNVNPDEQMQPIEFRPDITPWDDFNSTNNPEQVIDHTHPNTGDAGGNGNN